MGLRHLDPDRRETVVRRLDVAESLASRGHPAQQVDWRRCAGGNGRRYCTQCQPGAASCRSSSAQLDAAVRAGDDTDTVAAIASGLLGDLRHPAVPLEWRTLLHGWPGCAPTIWSTSRRPSPAAASRTFDFSYSDSPPSTSWRYIHYDDDKVLLGGIGVLRDLPNEVNAVVSLCRLADDDMRDDMPTRRFGSSIGRGRTRTRTWTSC